MPQRILAFLLAAALTSGAWAQTCTTSWAAPTDGAWTDISKWTNGIPDASETACIQQSGTYTVTFDQDRDVGTLLLGGTSGTQTLDLARTITTLGGGTVSPNGRLQIQNSLNCATCDGLPRITGTLTVEGTITHIGLAGLVSQGGTLDIAPGGQLLVNSGVNGVTIGDTPTMSTLRLRGRAVFDPGGALARDVTIQSDLDIDGGTLDVRDGRVRLNTSGRLRNTSFVVADGGDVVFARDSPGDGDYIAQGTLSGEPVGKVRFASDTLRAGVGDATLAIGGSGLLVFELGSAGGMFRNTDLLRTRPNGLTIQQVVLENTGTVHVEATSVSLSEGAVLRNLAGATVDLVDGGEFRVADGTGRLENEGLIQSRVVTFTTQRVSSFGGRLRSQPGSELRIGELTRLDLDVPASASLPSGTRVTGDGTLFIGGATQFLIEGEVSPGTDAQPVATLGAQSQFFFSPTAGDPRLTIDVDAGGQSDRIDFQPTGASFPVRPAGTLVVRVRPGYTPQIGDTWTILQSPSANLIQGEFAQVVAEGAPEGVAFAAEYSNAAPSTITVRAVDRSVSAEDGASVQAMTLSAAPNPARGTSTVTLSLGQAQDAQVVVF
ncbi:hypothetical protein, partial [Rubrivirga sp.]|uniref:hypothetical protein n=1 Tax=Rubrivirga sp. TaxID=1885344 RepID=UPI003C72E954